MIYSPIAYQAILFGNMMDIPSSPETISKFLEIFQDKGFLPNTFQELLPNPSGNMNINRIRMISQNLEWSIEIPSIGIIISKNPLDSKGSNLDTIEDFIDISIEYFSRILNVFPRNGNRLSLLTLQMLPEMPIKKVHKIFNSVIKPSPFYEKNVPNEWRFLLDSRVPIKIHGKQEIFNVNTSMNYVQDFTSDIPQVQKINLNNRIIIQMDINTFQGKIDPRFDLKSTIEFFKESLKLNKKILSEWGDYLDERIK